MNKGERMGVFDCPFRDRNEVTVQQKPKSKSKDEVGDSDTLEDKLSSIRSCQ